MKIKILLSIILLFTMALCLFSRANENPGKKMHFTAGLSFSYHRVNITMGDEDTGNTSQYFYPAVELGLEFSNHLALGVLIGYNECRFDEAVNFVQLPLSLQSDGKKFKTALFGVRAASDILSTKKFVLSINGELLYFKATEKNLTIDLPIVSGRAELEHSVYQAAVELAVKYRLSGGLTVFAGPRLNMINGEFRVQESIDSLEGSETLKYEQKNLPALIMGMDWEKRKHVRLSVKLALLSQTSLSIGLFYII